MRTLRNYALIYDDQCPICQVYTKALVVTGVFEKKGREAYQVMDNQTCTLIDKDRARNEIALVNKKTGEVNYGLDSLLKVTYYIFPFAKYIFKIKPIYWLFKIIYSTISYNRKIIMPSGRTNDVCTPDFHLKNRSRYIIFAWIMTSYLMYKYSFHLGEYLPKSNYGREFFICGGQIIFQAMILWKIKFETKMDYLGNMMTISLVGSILLGFGILSGKLFSIQSSNFYLAYFGFVVFLMLLEHNRRAKILALGLTPTISWVIYRIIILIFIFFNIKF